MCGITGLMAFNEVGRIHLIHLDAATRALNKRGPDFQNTLLSDRVGLGHRRLAVIDPRQISNQPMADPSGRYHMVFNGEIYNYRDLRNELEQLGVSFETDSDTEVFLKAFMTWGKSCLDKLNGFFAFCIYDQQAEELFLARDRVGIKPLYYLQDDDKFLFASGIKSLLAYNVPKRINQTALQYYLQLNYTPAPLSMIEGVVKLKPGHCITVKKKSVEIERYYSIPKPNEERTNTLEAHKKLEQLLEQSVEKRLVADVPIGAFLSGGIDSSVIVALASRFKENLDTFSIGYKDNPYFDETHYAALVADRFRTNHHVFSLTHDDLLNHLGSMMEAMDEPFADSSALPVYVLSKETRKIATVALSGDGADELFGGYNKHAGWLRSHNPSVVEKLATRLASLWDILPKSRSGKLTNLFRQLDRFAKGQKLPYRERYWLWASISSKAEVDSWLKGRMNEEDEIKQSYLALFEQPSLNHFLYTDAQLVLANDMLTKVDMMSMANSLEVRVPFLDHHLVEFAFQLEEKLKIDKDIRKKVVRDTFRSILPKELYHRPKKGFEVPLLSWMKKELSSRLDDVLFDFDFLSDQALFHPDQIMSLKKKLHSFSPEDSHAQIWGLFVFQSWYRQTIG